jgi:phage portal protein BeeE
MKLPSLFNFFKAAPVRKPNEAPRAPLGLIGRQTKNIIEYNNVVAAERAMQHPIVFRALHKLASSVAQVQWYAEPDPDVVASERAGAAVIKTINSVLASPNDNMAPDMLRYWLALTLACYGRIPFKVGISGVNNQLNAVYPLDARYVRATLDPRGNVREYEYGSESDREVMPTRKRASEGQSYLYEIYTPNLAAKIESTRNSNVLGAIGLPTQIIELLLQRAWDTASGHPNNKYIITAEKTLTVKQKDAIKEHLENSVPDGEESGNILFLYNTSVEVHTLDNNLSDIHSKMPLDDMARMIYGAFGIPISLVGMGAADGAKFAGNYIESRQAFWEDTIIPNFLTPIATGLTLAVCPYGARIRFDLDTIDAIQDSRSSRANKLEDVSFLTSDEKRELAGYPALTAEQRAQLDREAALRATNRQNSTQSTSGA